MFNKIFLFLIIPLFFLSVALALDNVESLDRQSVYSVIKVALESFNSNRFTIPNIKYADWMPIAYHLSLSLANPFTALLEGIFQLAEFGVNVMITIVNAVINLLNVIIALFNFAVGLLDGFNSVIRGLS